MKFKIVGDLMYAVKTAGYKLDPTAEMETDFTDCLCGYDYYERENKIAEWIDGFYDLDTAYLCRGEDGELYAVEYIWCRGSQTLYPAIWQRVIKNTDI